MPARTNDFQRLILAIEQAFAHSEVTVQESGMLRDRDSGTDREVDVLIVHKQGVRQIITCVECNGKSRPATIEWVDQMMAKHASLPTNKLTLVAKAGFTKSALTKAKQCKIDALTLGDALTADWAIRIPNVILNVFSLPVVTHVRVKFRGDRPAAADELHLARAKLRDAHGVEHGALSDFVSAWIGRPDVVHLLWSSLPPNHFGEVDAKPTLPEGAQLMFASGAVHAVEHVHVVATCEKHVSRIPMTNASYGVASISTGKGSLPGHVARVVAVASSPKDRRLGVTLERTKEKAVDEKRRDSKA